MTRLMRKIKYWASFLAFLMIINCLFPQRVSAEANERKVVRIGWFQSDMFQEGMSEDAEKSGYCYDYLQKVANYTKWEYEYVYGDWTELYNMLLKGEIDLLGGVSWTEERQELMLFPDTAMGTDQYYIYKHDDDVSILAEDYATLSGKKVGGIVDNRTATFTKQWIEENNLDLEIVYFESFEEQEKAFKRGDLDLLGQTIYNVLSMEGISIVAKVGEEPFYLAINKNRPDLRDELNQALSTMIATDPFVLQDMQYENYGASMTSRNLTDMEKKWVEEHSTITVGYLENYLPYSDTSKNGMVTGLVTDVLEAVLDALDLEKSLTILYKPYGNYDAMIAGLRNKEIDIAFPVYGNLWLLEKNGIDASSAVLSGTETLFYKGTYSENAIKKIAVNKNNGMQIAYSKKQFPEAELIEYSSIEACLDAVMKGDADCTIINTMRSALVTGNSKYSSLLYVQLNIEEERCFGVNSGETELLQILNRGLSLIGDTYGVDNSYQYINELYKYTAYDFIRENLIAVAVIMILVVGIFVWFLLWNNKRKEKHRKLREQAENLEEINSNIIDILGNVVESRNMESGAHVKRVKGYTRILGMQLMKDFPEYGLTAETVNHIAMASALHDIGKISIPDDILLKPERLSAEEFEKMKLHTTKGCDILGSIGGIWDEAYRKTSYDICRYHHEKYDGGGYPEGLKGEEIPLSAQLVSIADCYDALTTQRVYKNAYTKEEAFRMIVDGECGAFSPKLVEAFKNARVHFEEYVDLNNVVVAE